MSFQIRRILAEPCEAAQPETTKPSHYYVTEEESLHDVFNSFRFVEDRKPFCKLQSPTTSELDSDSNSEDEFCKGSGSDASHFPEGEDVGAPELLQNATHFCGAAKNEPQIAQQLQDVASFTHSEESQPNASRGEMVTGCHSSLNVSRFYLELRHGLIQPESRFQRSNMLTEVPCGDIWRLLAQQIVIVKGWKEHVSSLNKHSLKNLAYTQDLINGHPIGKCILTAFYQNSLYYRGDFIGERKGPPLVNSSQNTTPHRKLFSLETDASISMWEKAFSEQFGKQRILFKERDITAPLLVVILYRCAYQGSIMINHFILSECRDCMRCRLSIQKAMLKLDYHHSLMCRLARQMSSKEYNEESATKDHREQIHLLYHHCESLAHNYPRIEFPHFVEVGIQRREKKLTKLLHIIYMQIPPYFFAVPADCCEDTTFSELQPQFPSVIREIHKKLEIEQECFLRQRPDLRDKEDLVMIYPYRFDPEGQHSECRFLRVDINIDGG